MKKILFALIFLVLVTLAAFFGWYLFFRTPETETIKPQKNILPFGSENNTPASSNNSSQSDVSLDHNYDEINRNSTNLFRISASPVAGAVILNKTSQGTSTLIVRYVDRATGHVYDVDLTTLAKSKILNQTLPQIYEAYFRPDGNSILFRSLNNGSDIIENLDVTITPPKDTLPSSLYTATTTLLKEGIGSVAVGSGNALFYTLQDPSSIVTSSFNGTGLKTILNTPYKDWNLATTEKGLIILTKPSADASGFAYTLNTTNGTMTKLLGPLDGLMVIPSSSGKQILYSYVETGKTRLFAKKIESGTLFEVLPVTLAEKCVWSTKNSDRFYCAVPITEVDSIEPDSWYKGLTHFSDSIWFFDTKVNIAQTLVEPKTSLGIDIDAMDIKLSPNENYLVFINRNDLSLWALKIEPF